MRRQR
jgi:hypothetical protein